MQIYHKKNTCLDPSRHNRGRNGLLSCGQYFLTDLGGLSNCTCKKDNVEMYMYSTHILSNNLFIELNCSNKAKLHRHSA